MKTNLPQKPDSAAPRSEYIQLLCALHALMRNIQPDAPELRALREQMNLPGEQLSDDEIEHMHGLSADLYDLADIPAAPSLPADLTLSSAGQRLWNAYVENSWDTLLYELRACKGQLAPEPLAVLRAYAWAKLQEPAPQLAFLGAAAHLALQACAHQLAAPQTAPVTAKQEIKAANSAPALRERRDAQRASRGDLTSMMFRPAPGEMRRSRP